MSNFLNRVVAFFRVISNRTRPDLGESIALPAEDNTALSHQHSTLLVLMEELRALEGCVDLALQPREWLTISMDGFAEQQRGRPLSHLIKELVQNSLDSINENGVVSLIMSAERPSQLSVLCSDNGSGMEDIHNLSVMFHTSKKDSHLSRGRMGRGFKEPLSLANFAVVESKKKRVIFLKKEGILYKTNPSATDSTDRGFTTMMIIDHVGNPTDIFTYFTKILVKDSVIFSVNGQRISHRPSAYDFTTNLSTEVFEKGQWLRPMMPTTVRLVPLTDGEVPTIYEMGIPVCNVDWPERYHCDIQQRIPMNPNRDAVVGDYTSMLRAACLPALVPELTKLRALESWISDAAMRDRYRRDKADLKKMVQQIVDIAYGDKVATSSPPEGKYDYDAEAIEAGYSVINTGQMEHYSREMLFLVAPTAKNVVKEKLRLRWLEVKIKSLSMENVIKLSLDGVLLSESEMHVKAIAHYGKDRILDRMRFAELFSKKLLSTRGIEGSPKEVRCGYLEENVVATWSDSNILCLSLAYDKTWSSKLGREFLSTLIHEAAHHQAFHHGRSFSDEVETCAGAGSLVMLDLSSEYLYSEFSTLKTDCSPIALS